MRDYSSQTRRRFLATSLAAMAAAAANANAADSPLSLGFSLYGTKSLAMPDALKLCSEIGYKSVELSLLPGFPTEPAKFPTDAREKLRADLAANKLDCSALMISISLAGADAAQEKAKATLREACEFARAIDPAKPPLIETTLGGKPDEWEPMREKFAERLRAWSEICGAANVTLAVKAHVNNTVNVPERLLWLIENVKHPALALTYDYSHFELAGIPMRTSMEMLLPHSKYVAVKDSVGEPSKFQFLLPGKGRINYATYFATLKELGYRGAVDVEVSAQIFNKPEYDPAVAARECYAALAGRM